MGKTERMADASISASAACLSYVEDTRTHGLLGVTWHGKDGSSTELMLDGGMTSFELSAAMAPTAEETIRRLGLIHEQVRKLRDEQERELVSRAVSELGFGTDEGR